MLIHTHTHTHTHQASTGGSVVKILPVKARDVDSVLGLGRSPGEENGNPL